MASTFRSEDLPAIFEIFLQLYTDALKCRQNGQVGISDFELSARFGVQILILI